MDRTILHIDANSYYASVECLHDPTLRGRPVAVGGDAEARHGIILSVNQLAKPCGIKVGEALWQARQKCPELVIVPPHYEQYLRFSRLTRAIYGEYSPQVEPFGLDEAWVEVTNTDALAALGAQGVADEIRLRVREELGITVSVGVSYNKIFAKLGSDYKKPDAVTVFSRDTMREKIWPLPASDLLYVGRSTEKKLHARGVHTIGQLAQTPAALLESWLGKWGLVLSAFANGLDLTPVSPAGETDAVKSIGNSTTTPRDLCCDRDAEIIFWMLCESVAARLRAQGLLCRTVQIGLRTSDLRHFERQKKLPQATGLACELHAAAMELLRGSYDWQLPLRSVGVRGAELVPASAPRQTSLFEDTARREKREKLELAVDDIRQRLGYYSIGRAAMLSDPTLTNINPKDDHVIHPVGFFKAV